MQNLPNRFSQCELSAQEDEVARAVNAYTFAFIQNKVADYAHAVVEFQYDMSKPLESQVIEHEKLKAQVVVLEELMQELQVPIESQSQQPSSNQE